MKLSWPAYKNHGWESTKETIRHELIHVEQFHETDTAGHGRWFRRKADMMDCSVRCDARATDVDYKYLLICQRCGQEYRRQRKSKTIKHPDRYNCGKCNGDLSVKHL